MHQEPDAASHRDALAGRRRSGSETRVRQDAVGVRLTPDERQRLEGLAAGAGIAVADYLRRSALGSRKAVGQGCRPTVDTAALRALAGQAARIGNNVNQVARHMNTAAKAGEPATPDIGALRETAAALHALRAELRRVLGVQGVLEEEGACS